MLNQSDAKVIRDIVRDENQGLREDFTDLRKEVRTEISSLSDEMQKGDNALRTELKTGLQKFRDEMHRENKEIRAEMKEGFAKLDKKMETVVNFLDREYLLLSKRIDRIEQHLGLEPMTI